jgi:hypothetical protein
MDHRGIRVSVGLTREDRFIRVVPVRVLAAADGGSYLAKRVIELLGSDADTSPLTSTLSIDRDPRHFRHVVSHLSSVYLTGDAGEFLTDLTKDALFDLRVEATFLGLSSLVQEIDNRVAFLSLPLQRSRLAGAGDGTGARVTGPNRDPFKNVPA